MFGHFSAKITQFANLGLCGEFSDILNYKRVIYKADPIMKSTDMAKVEMLIVFSCESRNAVLTSGFMTFIAFITNGGIAAQHNNCVTLPKTAM